MPARCGMEIKGRVAFALFKGMRLQACAGFPLLLESGGVVNHVNSRHFSPSVLDSGLWLKAVIHHFCCLSLEALKLEQNVEDPSTVIDGKIVWSSVLCWAK